MLTYLLITLIIFFGHSEDLLGTTLLSRPLVLGPLVGLVLGDLQQGVIIGASLELIFMGNIKVGAAIPPDVVTQLKAGADNLNKMKTNICSGGGAAGGAPPAPSLSEALGTATMPATSDDAPRRRGGTLDTLTGAPIR